ncbi:hypothetical protein IWQ61_004746 [Dispira simplex]|nr:hypothetical protein IWQ61_004746 [Dispira simplex]
MWISALQVFLIALANAGSAEYLGYRLVYGTEDYQNIKRGLARATAKLESEESGADSGNPRKRQRRIAELKKQVKVYKEKATSMTMRTTLLMAGLQIAVFYCLNSVGYSGVVVAKLPFIPFGFIQGLSHRNLPGEDATDCSAVFLFVVSSLFIRNVLQRYFDFSIRQVSPWSTAFEQAQETNL